MAGVNPVGTFGQTISAGGSAQTTTTYFAANDANWSAAQRVVDAFAPHPASTANMTVVIDAGFVSHRLPTGLQVITEVAQQTVTISAAPGSPNNRLDLIVVDAGTGAASVITGTPATTATAPALTAGKLQIALVSVANGTSAITSSLITDLRQVWSTGVPDAPWAVGAGTGVAITATYTPANTALSDGLLLCVRAPAANSTTTPTFAPDGLSAAAITKTGGNALALGDIAGQYHELLLRYNLANARWELLNPAPQVFALTSAEIVAALGFTPQNAAVGPTSTQIDSGLGYTPAKSTDVGNLSVSASTSTASALTLTSANFGGVIQCTGTGTFAITIPAADQTGRTITIVSLAGNSVTAVAASGVTIYGFSSSGSLPAQASPVAVSASYGGLLRLVSVGTNWVVAGSEIGSTSSSGGGGGGGTGA